MKMEKVAHVGIKCLNLDESIKFYTEILGIKNSDISVMEIPNDVRIATINRPEASIELLQFISQGPLAKFGDDKVDSIHHYAIDVDNITDVLTEIKKSGGTLLNDKPMELPNGRKVAFALPKNSKVLIEFIQ
jgi:methylmalonyl-CoA epimerase